MIDVVLAKVSPGANKAADWACQPLNTPAANLVLLHARDTSGGDAADMDAMALMAHVAAHPLLCAIRHTLDVGSCAQPTDPEGLAKWASTRLGVTTRRVVVGAGDAAAALCLSLPPRGVAVWIAKPQGPLPNLGRKMHYVAVVSGDVQTALYAAGVARPGVDVLTLVCVGAVSDSQSLLRACCPIGRLDVSVVGTDQACHVGGGAIDTECAAAVGRHCTKVKADAVIIPPKCLSMLPTFMSAQRLHVVVAPV